ncbi:MAG: hypothetical protein AB9891_20725 [Anaerolineaceae bacterium]
MKINTYKIIPFLVLIAVFSAQCTGGNQVPSTSTPEVNLPVSQDTQPANTMPPPTEAAPEEVAPSPSAISPTMAEPPSNSALDGKALASERCTACHSFSRIESASKTSDDWSKTVQRMVSKGAVLTADEQQAVINFLSETYLK